MISTARPVGVVGCAGLLAGRRCCPGTRCRKASTPAPGCRGLWSSEDYASRPRADRSRTAVGGWRRCCWRSLRLPRGLACCRHRARAAGARCSCCAGGIGPRRCSSRRRSASACAAGPPDWLTPCSASSDGRQVGIGAGGALVLIALLSLLSIGLALRGALRRRRLRRRRGRPRSRRRSCCSPPGRSCASCCRPSRTATAPSAGAAGRPAGRREDLEPALPHRRRPLRRRVEHAVPRAGLRRRHDGAGARLRADRHAHRLSPTRRRCAC